MSTWKNKARKSSLSYKMKSLKQNPRDQSQNLHQKNLLSRIREVLTAQRKSGKRISQYGSTVEFKVVKLSVKDSEMISGITSISSTNNQ